MIKIEKISEIKNFIANVDERFYFISDEEKFLELKEIVPVLADNINSYHESVECLHACNEIDFTHILKDIENIRNDINDLSTIVEGMYNDIKRYCIENTYHLANCDLSVRSYNVLMRAGYRDLRDVADCSISELKNVRNMGKASLREIANKIANVLNDNRLLKEYQEMFFDIDETIAEIIKINESINNRRVVLLINLAKDNGATQGEKINSINLCKKILHMSL